MAIKEIEISPEHFKNISTLSEELDSHMPHGYGPIVYRGVSDVAHDLTPSLYREGMEDVSETELFKHFRLQHPKAARDYADDWELMSFLRHSGFPVRLLDFSHNILVALYFASCAPNEEFDAGLYCVRNTYSYSVPFGGKIHIDMDKWRRESYRVDDFRVMANALGIENAGDCEIKFRPRPESSYFTSGGRSDPDTSMAELIHSASGLGRLKSLAEFSKSHYSKGPHHDLCMLDVFLRAPENQHFLNDLFIETSTRDQPEDMSVAKLATPHFIEPPVSNPRVRAQNGLFLVAGGTAKRPNGGIISPLLPMDDHVEGVKLTIPAELKGRIQRELSTYNIAQHTLFPEIDHQVSHIVKLASANAGHYY